MSDAYVPGVMRCAKCNFVLHRVNLHVHSGGVSAGDNKSEPCPNGCGPLWPMSWRQQAEDLQARCEEQLALAVAYRSALEQIANPLLESDVDEIRAEARAVLKANGAMH